MPWGCFVFFFFFFCCVWVVNLTRITFNPSPPPEEQHSTPLPPPHPLFPPTSQSSTNTLTTTTNPKLQDAGLSTTVGGGVRRQRGFSGRLGGQGDIPWIVVWQKDVQDKSWGKALMIDNSLWFQCLNTWHLFLWKKHDGFILWCVGWTETFVRRACLINQQWRKQWNWWFRYAQSKHFSTSFLPPWHDLHGGSSLYWRLSRNISVSRTDRWWKGRCGAVLMNKT